jgi:hypothetical protein
VYAVAGALGLPPWWLNEQSTVYISGKDDPGKRLLQSNA